MNICVDVGNSTICIGEYQNNELRFSTRFLYSRKFSDSEFIEFFIKTLPSAQKIDEVDKIIVSSVVPEINDALFSSLEKLYGKKPIPLDLRELKLNFKFDIDNPLECGGDLIADLAGGFDKYGYPLLIVDLGTASKIVYFDKKGKFASANILPGIKLCRNSLNTNTSLLPHIDLFTPKTIIAKNTIDAMNTGLVYGHVDMVEGTIKRYNDELKTNLKVVVTGGYMPIVKELLKPEYIFDDSLTLDGLNVLANLNR